MSPDANPRRRALSDYGPVQMCERLGLSRWQMERARAAGLIPPPDRAKGRWAAAVVERLEADLEAVVAQVGTVPDLGAWRAAEMLSGRFGLEVEPYVLAELDRHGLVPVVDWFKDHPVYCGRALETFDDLPALQRAMRVGRLLTAYDAAAYLRIRASDFAHLVKARWVEAAGWGRGPFQRRRDEPAVPLYRVGDLDVLAEHPAINWDAVRATPAGRPSPLARLTQHQPRNRAAGRKPRT